MEGPVDVPTKFHTFAALIKHGEEDELFAFSTGGRDDPGLNALTLYRRILALEVPKRIKDLRIESDAEVRANLESLFSIQGMPSTVVALGNTLSNNKNVTIISTLAGASPETALSEIQEKVKGRMAKFN